MGGNFYMEYLDFSWEKRVQPAIHTFIHCHVNQPKILLNRYIFILFVGNYKEFIFFQTQKGNLCRKSTHFSIHVHN